GSEVLMRAATAIPTKVRTTARDWAMNGRIRREGTRNLTEVAGRIGAKAFVQESIVWAVGSADGAPFDENAPPVNEPILASALDAERIGRDAGRAHGFEAAVLRFGAFYSADGWHTRIFGESLARARPVLIGSANPVWSMIHADDASSAFVAAVETPRSGVWHIVDDHPVPLPEYLAHFATMIGARPPRRIPRGLARLVLSRYVTQLLTSSFETSNARFRRDFAWKPAYPTYVEGLEEIVAAWRAEGFPPRKR
ncbi:MAG: NAD-dependent epimerase/dehydratase family protein, partial [Thermoplasmata archaeon]|nr:NAD-dependent epimerase/dehydratase family protein [Thermoplasmata archaeon]